MHRWPTAPRVPAVFGECVAELAATALASWPRWYPTLSDRLRFEHGLEGLVADELEATRIAAAVPHAIGPWIRRAFAACRRGRAPYFEDLPPSEQARQLALALDPTRLLAAFLHPDVDAAEADLRLHRETCVWFARHTGARVLAIVPEQALAVSGSDLPVHHWPAALANFSAAQTRATSLHDRDDDDGPSTRSRGEALLAARLAADPELGGLFVCNEAVRTVRGTSHNVDLVWSAGKVVVEVDGYRYHSPRRQFVQDRQRDYELLVSGYLVLRLDHDQVVEDVQLAVEKVRDVVRYRAALRED